MPQEDRSVTRIGAVRIFAETAGGQWLPVGSAQVDRHEGRDVLRVTLDAMPTTGRLCLSLADLDVLPKRSAAGGVLMMSKPVAIVILSALSWAPLCIGADWLHLTLPALLCWCCACDCAATLAVLTLIDGGPRR